MRALQRDGIAIIMAIMVIVIIGTIMALAVALTTETTQRNLNTYLYEQAEIMADSAREYAMYKIDTNTTQCVDFSSIIPITQDTFYNIDINASYVTPTGTCGGGLDFTTTPDPDLDNNVTILNITVSIDKSATLTNEDIRFHKRYIENIKP